MLYKKKEQGETAVLSFFISTSYDMVQTMSSLTLPRSSLLQGLPPVGEASRPPCIRKTFIKFKLGAKEDAMKYKFILNTSSRLTFLLKKF